MSTIHRPGRTIRKQGPAASIQNIILTIRLMDDAERSGELTKDARQPPLPAHQWEALTGAPFWRIIALRGQDRFDWDTSLRCEP